MLAIVRNARFDRSFLESASCSNSSGRRHIQTPADSMAPCNKCDASSKLQSTPLSGAAFPLRMAAAIYGVARRYDENRSPYTAEVGSIADP